MRRIADINWSIKLYAVSGVYILGLLAVGVVGGYHIYSQSATTGAALRASQSRADAAGKARVAIVNMGLAEAQTLSAVDGDEKRTAAIGAIRAFSYLDESIQRLQQALAGNAKVEQLSELLKSIGPTKMQFIRAARANNDATAREKLSSMEGPMTQISSLSAELVQDAQNDLAGAVDEQNRRSKSTILLLGCLVAGGILVSLLASWLVGRLLSRPLAAFETSVRSLATGDLTIKIPNFGGDEIGRTASAMGNMVADLHAMVTNIESNGRSVTAHSESVEEAANNLQNMFGRLQEAVETIRGDSSLVLTSTNDTIGQLRDAAVSAQSTAEAVARNSREVRNMADTVSSFHGRLEQILAASHELMGKVQTIESFAQTIKSVSSQATLLALNASIQAAHAGEHGKAFNVVAGEVRKLAQNSEAATQQIASLTESIRSSIGETVTMLEQAKSESHENVGRLLAVSDEAAGSSKQSWLMHDRMHSMLALVDNQGSAVTGINRTVVGLFEMSESSRHQAEGLHALSEELNSAANGLTTVVARFQLHPSEATGSGSHQLKENPMHRAKRKLFLATSNILIMTLVGTVLSQAQTAVRKSSFVFPTTVPTPTDNKVTVARVELGKMLFFDPRLSGSSWISCASCHNPTLSWSDGLPTAIGNGMGVLKRATPTIVNSAFNEVQMWDGRFHTLEEQAAGPMQAPGEMNGNLDNILKRLMSIPGYVTQFEKAYPGEGITKNTLVKAIASFERTVISKDAPFDAWIAGNRNAIGVSAKRGYALFVGKANCVACHSGPNFTDSGFHNIGLADNTDDGRYAKLPLKAMKGAFKTPTLRDIALTAPYMHNGTYSTLEEVVALYNRGGDCRDNLDPNIKPLLLTDGEQVDLVQFLRTLTGREAQVTLPRLPQ